MFTIINAAVCSIPKIAIYITWLSSSRERTLEDHVIMTFTIFTT